MKRITHNAQESRDAALSRDTREHSQNLSETAGDDTAPDRDLSHRQEPRRDLSDIVETWVEDPAFDAAIADQDADRNR